MLSLVKDTFPDIYHEHIHDRQAVFVEEHAPVSRGEKMEMLGQVPEDMRILWALSSLLCTYYPTQMVHPSDAVDIAQELRNYQVMHMSAAVQLGFWEALSNSLKLSRPPEVLCLGDNWSVNRLLEPTYEDVEVDEVKAYLVRMTEFMNSVRMLEERQRAV